MEGDPPLSNLTEIASTKLRKYIATISQVVSLKGTEVDRLSKTPWSWNPSAWRLLLSSRICSANEGRARNKWCGDLVVGSQTPTVKGSSFKRVRARHSTNEHQCKRNSKVLGEPSPYLPVKHFMVFKAITVVGAIPPKVKLQSLICHELEFVCFSSCTLMAVFTMAMSSSRLRACLKANMCSCC